MRFEREHYWLLIPLCYARKSLKSNFHIISHRMAGAGEDKAGGLVCIGEYVVFNHFYFSGNAPGRAGGAHPIAATVGQGQVILQGGLQYGLVLAHGQVMKFAVEFDPDIAGRKAGGGAGYYNRL